MNHMKHSTFGSALVRIFLGVLLLIVFTVLVQNDVFSMPTAQIILPDNGTVTVNFIGTGGPGDRTTCTGDFGLKSPSNILIYPNYLYFAGVPFPIDKLFSKGEELIFYIDIAPGSVCNDETYFSNDPNHAIIEHPTDNTWIIKWEDWQDADFNDLVVEIVFEKSESLFDLPFGYSGSSFALQSKDS